MWSLDGSQKKMNLFDAANVGVGPVWLTSFNLSAADIKAVSACSSSAMSAAESSCAQVRTAVADYFEI